jgi:hypothetical protein
MKSTISALMLVTALWLVPASASADEYSDTIAMFKKAGESADFFKHAYAYLVFPTIGKGGLGVGAAHGSGRAYEQGKYVGDVKMNQVSIGLQAGGQAFSQIVFFEDKHAFEDFTRGEFEFDATVQAVAITASATASAGSTGTSAGAAGRQERCGHVRQVPQGAGGVHRRERRIDVPGRRRGPEVQVQEEVVRGPLVNAAATMACASCWICRRCALSR